MTDEPPADPAPPRARRRRARSVVAALLVVLSVVGLVASTTAFWARGVVFEEDRWISTVRTLPEQHEVAIALADYLTEQLFVAIDFEERLTDALPEDVSVVVPLLSSAIRGFVADETAAFIESETFARLWVAANRQAHRALIAILDDQGLVPGLERTDDTVTLDLVPAVNALLDQVGDVAGQVIGADVSLPEIGDDETTRESIRRLGERLGVDLPEDFGQVTVYQGDRLPEPRDTVVLIERLRVLLAVATAVLAVAALAVAPNRRRTTLALLLGAAVGFALLLNAPHQLARLVGGFVADDAYRAAAERAVDVIFASYESLYRSLLVVALVAATVIVASGPSRIARRGRSALAGLATRSSWAEPAQVFLQRWLGWLRIGGFAFGLAVVLTATRRSLTAWFVLFALLAAYHALLTLVPNPPRDSAAQQGSPP